MHFVNSYLSEPLSCFKTHVRQCRSDGRVGGLSCETLCRFVWMHVQMFRGSIRVLPDLSGFVGAFLGRIGAHSIGTA